MLKKLSDIATDNIAAREDASVHIVADDYVGYFESAGQIVNYGMSASKGQKLASFPTIDCIVVYPSHAFSFDDDVPGVKKIAEGTLQVTFNNASHDKVLPFTTTEHF